MTSAKPSNLIRSETLVHIMALMVFGSAFHRSNNDPSYDPMPMYTFAIATISAARIAPTEKIDRPIQEVLSKFDIELTSRSEDGSTSTSTEETNGEYPH